MSLLDQFEVQFNELSNGEIIDGELSELQPVELAGIVNKFPQILINVADVDKAKIDNSELVAAVKKAENDLGEKGRVLLRSSGTEPLIRVMVEAETMKQAQDIAQLLAGIVKKTC